MSNYFKNEKKSESGWVNYVNHILLLILNNIGLLLYFGIMLPGLLRNQIKWYRTFGLAEQIELVQMWLLQSKKKNRKKKTV